MSTFTISDQKKLSFINYFIVFLTCAVCYGQFVPFNTFFIDDYFFFTQYYEQKTLKDFLGVIKYCLTGWPQGRPLGFMLPFSMGYMAAWAGQAQIIYWLGLAIIYANAILLYHILKPLTGPGNALLGALIYLTYPADVTKLLAIHEIQIQPGIFCALCAILIYQSAIQKRRKSKIYFSYALAYVALLFYESSFLPFVAAPALSTAYNQGRTYLKHFFIILVIILTYISIRKYLGEARIESLEFFSGQLFTLLKNIIKGSVSIPYGYIRIFEYLFCSAKLIHHVLLLCACIILIYYLYANNPGYISFNKKHFIILCLFIPSGYLFSITHNTFVFLQISTSVHIAESVIITFPWIYFLCCRKFYRYGLILTILLLGLSVNYALYIGNNLKQITSFSQMVTANILDSVRDYADGDCILVDFADARRYRQGFFNTFSWGNAYGFDYLINKTHTFLNGEPYRARMVCRVMEALPVRYTEAGKIGIMNTGYPEFSGSWMEVEPQKLIYLRVTEDGTVIREGMLPESLLKGNIVVKPKSQCHGEPQLTLNEEYIDYIYGNDFWGLLKTWRKK